jgi:DNA-binding SARP family transcriptional activator/Tfp pilus assembly protein PilF
MEFGLLGPLMICVGTLAVPVPRGKQRAVLAALLMAANRVVSLDELAETLWGSDPPPSARVAVQNHVMRLRRTMGGEGSRVITQPPGYLIRVHPGELDVTRFQGHLDAARAAARESSWDAAAAQAHEALSLYRGEPLADVDSETLVLRETPQLAELRLQALETRIDADLHLGRHAEIISELRQLTGAHPLREQLHSQLMLALYRSHRQAEALSAYQDARKILIEEIGAEPGRDLQELHRQILTADPALTTPDRMSEGNRTRRAVPRELPAPVAHFAGRAAELAALTGLLDRFDELRPGMLVISVIGGTAGVGKTALAVQWAHTTAGRFPGGQLYVNLRGYDPDQPVAAADTLAGFLRSLGVPGQEIPPGEEERAVRYRSLLADKKLLIVLDNAGSVEQVRPLLPGSAGCAVVVTSRDALAGLVARHGATRLELDLLPAADAVGLLRTLIGPRVDDDPDAAVTLAGQCCRLPLALRVAAELAAARPDVPLAGLTAELADQRRRLDLLDAGGDPRTAVRAVFSWSYRHLEPAAARAFKLASLHPGADFDPYAAAALTSMGLQEARAVLDVLTRAHLIWPAGQGRYGMHDLLRAYAGELAARDGQQEQDTALTRLFDYYLHTAAATMDTLYPDESHRRPRIPSPPDMPIPPVAEPAASRAWLDAERATLVAVSGGAAAHGWPGHATRLASILFRYLDAGGHYPEALTIHSHAHAAAQRAGDQAAEAGALNRLASVHGRQCRYQQAADYLLRALALFRQVGDRMSEGPALINLGLVYHYLGRYQEAIGLYRQALAIYRETGEQLYTAITLDNLGNSEERLGRYDQAARHHRQALAFAADTGAQQLESNALVNLGTVGLRQGRYRQADGHLYKGLALSREIGYREAEADALARIGDLCLRQGRPEEAVRHLREALALYRELGTPSGEADTLNSLGEVLVATGQANRARAEYTAALGLAAQTGDKYQQARAYNGLGHADHVTGNPGDARGHWQRALDLYTELSAPEANQVKAQLAACPGRHF